MKGADLIHFDVMDGHFVPNISYGMPVAQAVKRASSIPLDVHLMVEEPIGLFLVLPNSNLRTSPSTMRPSPIQRTLSYIRAR